MPFKNINEKISAIMGEIEYFKKDEVIKFNKNDKGYTVISEEKVVTIIRKKLIEYKINFFVIDMFKDIVTKRNSKMEETTPWIKEEVLCFLTIKCILIDCETNTNCIVYSIGGGIDSQDKAASKAFTSAVKNCLLKTFLIPCGDDPDKFSDYENNTDLNPFYQPTKKLTEAINDIANKPEDFPFNPSAKTEKKETNLNKDLISACLVEFSGNTGLGIKECKVLFHDYVGVKSLAELKENQFNIFVRKIVDETAKHNIAADKMPKLNQAVKLMEEK